MILASIKPYYYYLIAEGIKKIEVRKSALKNLSQDIAFYMSKDERSFAKIPKEFQEKYRKHFGKVGMRVVCDKVYEYNFHEGLTAFNSMGLPSRTYGSYLIFADDYKSMCLSYDEVKNYGKGKPIYGWHISDLKIYDKPKELSEFRKPLDSVYCSYFKDYCEEGCVSFGSTDYVCNDYWNWERGLIRPPQSWQYVEEIEPK